MIHSNGLFQLLSSMIGKQQINKNNCHFFPEDVLVVQVGNLDQIAPNLCNFIFHNPL